MLVFWKERLVFLAVPKTGTTALEGALAPKAALVFRDPPILKHTPLYRYRRLGCCQNNSNKSQVQPTLCS